MSVTGLSGYSSTLSLTELYKMQSTDSVSSGTTGSSSSVSSILNQTDSLDISKPSELYSKLQELAKSDPEKLKEVCADIAEKLRSVAENSNGRDDKMLSGLADKFQSVAEGGDVSQLKPPERPSFGGGSQKPEEVYSKQQDAGLVDFLNNQGSNSRNTDMDDLLSDIMSMVDEASGNQ